MVTRPPHGNGHVPDATRAMGGYSAFFSTESPTETTGSQSAAAETYAAEAYAVETHTAEAPPAQTYAAERYLEEDRVETSGFQDMGPSFTAQQPAPVEEAVAPRVSTSGQTVGATAAPTVWSHAQQTPPAEPVEPEQYAEPAAYAPLPDPPAAAPEPPVAAPNEGAAGASHSRDVVVGSPSTQWREGADVLPPVLRSTELLAGLRVDRRAELRSSKGMRGALNKVGFRLGLSPAEQAAEDRRNRIRRQLPAPYQIAVLSVKGGVGRTTTVAALGSTFAAQRPDRVIAVDANPDFGDLSTRTVPHPYGLTLRDLARAGHMESFAAVQSFTTTNSSDLVVLASPWTTQASEQLTGPEYLTAVEVLRRHYNMMIVDCGTGVLDSATVGVLQTSDAVLVVTPATVGGVIGAVSTLNWLASHGLYRLAVRSTVAIVHQHPDRPNVEVDAVEKLFATAERPTHVLPYDPHLAEGGEIDLRLLQSETRLALEELAAALSDDFPSRPELGR